jgi:hypothetical protein
MSPLHEIYDLLVDTEITAYEVCELYVLATYVMSRLLVGLAVCQLNSQIIQFSILSVIEFLVCFLKCLKLG